MPDARSRTFWLTGITAAVLLIAPLLIAVPKLTRALNAEKNRIPLGPATSLDRIEPGIQISPDGGRLAFAASRKGQPAPALWIQSLDKRSAIELPGTSGASFPFWSPDSQALGFFSHDELRTIDLRTHVISTICHVAGGGVGGDWSREGEILFASSENGRIYRVAVQTGQSAPVTSLTNDEKGHMWPRFLADGKRFIYCSRPSDANTMLIYAAALDSSDRSLITRANSNALAHCTADGKSCSLLFLLGRTLVSQPLDPSTLKTMGQESLVASDIILSRPWRLGEFSISGSGALSYSQSDGLYARRLVLVARTGKQANQIASGGRFVAPRISPDGRFVAFARMETNGTGDVWAIDLKDHVPRQITHESLRGSLPIWSHGGKQLVYASWHGNTSDLYIKKLGTTFAPTPLRTSESTKVPTSWSADGRFIAYDRLQPVLNPNWEIWILPLSDPYRPFCFRATSANVMDGQLSQDGKWIAFVSSDSGRLEVYAAPFSGRSGSTLAIRRISQAGGAEPRWRNDGHELYYIDDERNLVAVEFANGGPKAQRPLFNLAAIAADGADVPWAGYDASADGSHFVFNFAIVQDRRREVRVSQLVASKINAKR